MRLLFCANPLYAHRVDDAYQTEYGAARSTRADVSLIDFEALVYGNDPMAAVARVAAADVETLGIYRGWMLTVNQYARLFAALQERRILLINTPDKYAHCHLLPLSYAEIEPYTPKTLWVPIAEFKVTKLATLLLPFGTGPIIVKDYVKSRKHEWENACFIPSAADTNNAARIVQNFVSRQGSDLTDGLVFRAFEEFEPLTRHPQSGMPLTCEFRLIFLDGELLLSSRYWDSGDYAGETPPLEMFTQIAQAISSRFFTMDVAKTKTGQWRIIELGDAQVAELPPDTDQEALFRDCLASVSKNSGERPAASA